MRPIVLTIAGSDSSGGAGIQADIKTFSAFGVYGASVITSVTAQNTEGVAAVHVIPPGIIEAQIDAVASDLEVSAVKTGMLPNSESVLTVVAAVSRYSLGPLVVDPVMVATSGDALIDEAAVTAIRDRLIPVATLITPNLPEAARLLKRDVATTLAAVENQARALLELGSRAVLVKGGHLASAAAQGQSVDVLATRDGVVRIEGPYIDTRNTHGTGCTLSAAIAAGLAKGGELEPSVRAAKAYLTQALEAGRGLDVGSGRGPVDHLAARLTGKPGA